MPCRTLLCCLHNGILKLLPPYSLFTSHNSSTWGHQVHIPTRHVFCTRPVPCAPFPLLPGNTRHSHHHGKYGPLYENMGSAAKIKERLPRDLLEGGLLHPYAIATWTDREEKGAAVTWLGLPPCKSTPAARRPCHLVCTLQEVAELCLTARKKLQINSQGQACIKEYPN